MSGAGIKGSQIADGTVQGVDIDWDPHLSMKGHIIPDVHAAGWQAGSPGYDIGSASYKVRHLFLSDNSLWIGDSHKVDVDSTGKKKNRKRKKSSAPQSLLAARQGLGAAHVGAGFPDLSGGDPADILSIENEALIHAGKVVDASAAGALSSHDRSVALGGGTWDAGGDDPGMTLADWLAYAQSLPGHENADITDVFNPDEEADWEYAEEDGVAHAVVLMSPGGNLFQITVDDAGNLSTVAV